MGRTRNDPDVKTTPPPPAEPTGPPGEPDAPAPSNPEEGSKPEDCAVARRRAGAGAARQRRLPGCEPSAEPPPAGADPGQGIPALLDVEGLASQLGLTVHHVRRLVQERRIPYLKVGHFVRFEPAEVTRWLGEHRVAEYRGPRTTRHPRR